MACARCGRAADYFHCDLCSSIVREQEERSEREEEARSELLEALAKNTHKSQGELLEALRENAKLIADAQRNPGDYDCPKCHFRTLKLYAKRCRGCHADIEPSYWPGMIARKSEEDEREARLQAEWAKKREAEREADRKRKEVQEAEAWANTEWIKKRNELAKTWGLEKAERMMLGERTGSGCLTATCCVALVLVCTGIALADIL